VSRPFVLGLTSAAFGLILGAAQGVSSGSLLAFLSLFALITLIGCLTGAIVLGRHVQETADGYVGLGDTLLAMGTLIVLVVAVVFAMAGQLMGVVYVAVAVALTIFALKQERQVAIAVSGLMSVLVMGWVVSDFDAIVIGTAPALLWVFAAAAYTASLATGEQVGEAVNA